MAYNDSGELPVSQSTFSLGEYTFELKVQTIHEPGEEDVVSVFAICRGPDGTRQTQAVDFPVRTTKIESWSVEANEDTADVHVTVKQASMSYNAHSGDVIAHLSNVGMEVIDKNVDRTFTLIGTGDVYTELITTPHKGDSVTTSLVLSDVADAVAVRVDQERPTRETIEFKNPGRTVYEGFTFYYFFDYGVMLKRSIQYYSLQELLDASLQKVARIENRDRLVARFAIDFRDAGGGPDGDWDEPVDDGPPGTTLYVTVTGATAGNCTGTPADNETVKGYGDGGDGGYGGGGGAGASTVIIYEFATSIAESVQQEAISRGPGTGGPGGKGGKGGDGCILIFY